MERRDKKSKRNRNAHAVFVDGRKYESLFAAAIDFELNYGWLFTKLKNNDFAPVTISGHTIVLESWIAEPPEY